jgi:molecular chaperone GrpE
MNPPDQADLSPPDQPATSAPPAAEVVSPEPAASVAPEMVPAADLAAARKEAADNYDRYVRSVADMDNFRKRAVRDREDAAHRAASRILEDLMPTLDALGLGLIAAKAPNADLKTLVGGIGMVAEQLKTSLAQHGLKEVNPLGQPFDPNLHEAIAQQPSPEIAEGSVLNVVRTGYVLGTRLLRPASVVVSTGPAPIEAQS